jgi:phosphoserine phosphatase RsbU/P
LGLFEDATYDEISLLLDSGDILVCYSDGISDTQNATGEFFGWERLRDLIAENAQLPAGHLADRLLASVDDFSGGAPLADDRTLLVIKVL